MDEKLWIENPHLKVGIIPSLGGRVTDIYLQQGTQKNKNILWWDTENSEKNFGWLHGGMPLLFPFAGWVWDGEQKGAYRVGKEQYLMPIHGFAHSQQWTIIEAEESRLSLGLKDTKESLQQFPWKFSVQQSWELSNHQLSYRIEVENDAVVGSHGQQRMPVSLGLHPYFSAEVFPQAQVVLESEARSFCPVNSQGKADQEQAVQRIHWDLSEKFHHNAILCDFSAGEKLSVLKTKDLALSLESKPGAPTRCMVTWSDLQGKFFCLEPWMGKPDALNISCGIQWLELGERLNWSGSLSFS
ncbi:MAG: aldose 1-epimerase [Oligoflexales bacterium]